MTERIQKVLARAGVGSRRQVEEWIREGRLTVNGVVAEPGAQIGPRDRVALDGRALRLRAAPAVAQVLLYHRSARKPPRDESAGDAAEGESFESFGPSLESGGQTQMFVGLPKRAGARWVPVSPLPPTVGGLELLTTDGTLAQALMRRVAELPVEFALRVRGEPQPHQLQHLKSGVMDPDEAALQVLELESAGGSGFNRWVKLVVRGGRARDVNRLCGAAGLELSRLMRVSIGPLRMDRSLAREAMHRLEGAQLTEVYQLAGLPEPVTGKAAYEQHKRGSAERPVSRDREQGRKQRPDSDKRTGRSEPRGDGGSAQRRSGKPRTQKSRDGASRGSRPPSRRR